VRVRLRSGAADKVPTPLSDFALAVAALIKTSGSTAYTHATLGSGSSEMPIAYLSGNTQPAIYLDCSQWVNYALDSVAPIHQAVASAERNDPRFNPGRVTAYDGKVTINEHVRPWARADVLSYFFGNVANGSNGFTTVDDFGALQAGDLIAWAKGIYTDPSNPNASQIPSLVRTDDTGHAMIVVGTPVEVPRANWGSAGNGLDVAAVAHVYAVPLVDSSGTRHFGNLSASRAPEAFIQPIADSRSYGEVKLPAPHLPADLQDDLSDGGLGTGTLWFATDAGGHAIQYRWGWGNPWFGSDPAEAAVSISAARLTSTIDLSGSMLDASNRLVVTAFADAAPVLGGVAYNTQPEIITGAGGLWVVGGGKIVLGPGNSFSGGLYINDATVELAGASAAGTGTITFVEDATSTLLVDNAGAVPANRIVGFDAGDTIGLAFHGYTAGDHVVWTSNGAAGGTFALVGPNGLAIASLSLGGKHTSAEFSVMSDGRGGTLLGGPVSAAEIDDRVDKLFVGYFNRAPDLAGGAYWTDQLGRGAAPVAMAQSFALSNEAGSLYPYLASPTTASSSAIGDFVASVYGNLFGRAPDAQGEAYWTSALQTGASTAGAAILNIIAGARGVDATTLANKVTVGSYYGQQLFEHDAPFTLMSARTAIASVTSSDASVAAAKAAVDAYVGLVGILDSG
jgi:hypothetical protein